MKTHIHTERKTAVPATTPAAPIPAPKPHAEAPAPDLAAQLGVAARGHRFGALRVSPAPAGAIQPKLTVGAPDDQYEAEADRVAGQVMRMPDPSVQRVETPEEEDELLQTKPAIQRVETPEEEDELLQTKPAIQRVEAPEEELLQGRFTPVQRAEVEPDHGLRENKTGMPDNLKAGIESLSGMSLDDVRVHYNSAQPAQLNALAYAQGSDIHVAPGQEQHLPHEAWHVVQQVQGRVQPTMQLKDGVLVNDDAGLEHEADVMGERAGAGVEQPSRQMKRSAPYPQARSVIVTQRELIAGTEVVLDKGGVPIWTMEGINWHLTLPKGEDITRFHITTEDRSMSYWFTVNAGVVTSVKPVKVEYGNHKEKHASLDEAPGIVPNFVEKNISAILCIK